MLGRPKTKKRENYAPFIDLFERTADGRRQPRIGINP